MKLFEHRPHPHIAERQQPVAARPSFNDRVADAISGTVGTMRFFWGLAAFMALWMGFIGKVLGDGYPFGLMLLIVGGIFQALAMVAIMVAQDRQGRAADRRAESTFKDAEAILHECLQLQAHLQAQDDVLTRLIAERSRPADRGLPGGGDAV